MIQLARLRDPLLRECSEWSLITIATKFPLDLNQLVATFQITWLEDTTVYIKENQALFFSFFSFLYRCSLLLESNGCFFLKTSTAVPMALKFLLSSLRLQIVAYYGTETSHEEEDKRQRMELCFNCAQKSDY